MTSTQHPTGTTARRLPGRFTSRKAATAKMVEIADRNPEHTYEVREEGRKVRSTYFIACLTSPTYRGSQA